MKPYITKSIFLFFLHSLSQVIASESSQTAYLCTNVEEDALANMSLEDFLYDMDFGYDPDYVSESVIPMLAKQNDIEGLKTLVKHGRVVSGTVYANLDPTRKDRVASLEAIYDYTRNALHEAVYRGNLNFAHMLLDLGANVNAITNNNLKSSVQIAMDMGDVEMVQMLIDRGANVRANPLALHNLKDVKTEILEILDIANFDMNSIDEWGNSALSIAIEKKRHGFALKLLKHGADYRPELHDGRSLLNLAFSHESAELMRFAVENGDDINEVDRNGNTLLHRNMGIQKHPFWLKLLIDLGANIDARNNLMETPLHLAVNSKDSFMVQYLVENGANVNARDSEGRIPINLNFGSESESTRTFIEQCLLDHGSEEV